MSLLIALAFTALYLIALGYLVGKGWRLANAS